MDYAIETRGLTKVYGKKIRALDAVDLQVPAGCCFGLLGPNGAGKSTLVKTVLSIVRPTDGTATILGRDFRTPAARQGVGYLAEGHGFPPYLTGRQLCLYMGRLAGIPRSDLRRDVHEKLELVGMIEHADRKVSKYSKGMKQRVGLAQALLGEPRLVLLDEPTDGVDPVGRKTIREVVVRAARDGATVFINSHLLGEVEMICDEVAILHRGKLLQQGTVSDITRVVEERTTEIEVRFRTSAVPVATLSDLGVEGEGEVTEFRVTLTDNEQITALIDRLRAAGVSIYGVDRQRVSLEDAFMSLVQEQGAVL